MQEEVYEPTGNTKKIKEKKRRKKLYSVSCIFEQKYNQL